MSSQRHRSVGQPCLLPFPCLRPAFTGDTNKHRYVIATQSQLLRAQLRRIPAVPIVHINRSVMILEPLSDATLKTKEAVCFYLTNGWPL
jgi:hypothetical protein